ncbi:MAG: PEP-CTERM-box response regulator transcription factor [Burkholderiales bacterium]
MTDKRKSLLIVEDDAPLRKQLRWLFSGYDCVEADRRESAMTQLRRHEPSVVTVDLGLPPHPNDPTEGLALIEEITMAAPHTKIVVLSGQGDRANALKAIAAGAYDFHEKPFDPDVLALIVDRAFRLSALQEENRRLQSNQEHEPLGGIVSGDPGMIEIGRMISRVAPADVTVTLIGESGTGKELLARAVHDLSSRRAHRLVAINCAAIPENLLESELFGYEKGAFTGAARQTQGKVEIAHRGTLFLDEIGDLPLSLQAKLLRFLQERVIERVGGREEIAVDTRVVCATNHNLRDLISTGRFREDLYYRLNEITIEIPPLRKRAGDAVLLTHAFVRRYAAEHRRGAMTLLPEALRAIEAHTWPGNVRELENVVRRAVIMAESNVLKASDFGLAAPAGEGEVLLLREVRDRAERDAVVRALARTNGNLSKAADLLGVSRPTIYDLMNRLAVH